MLRMITRIVLLVLVAVPVWADDVTRTFTTDAEQLEVRSLVGSVRVTPTDGDVYEAVVTVRGADATPDLLSIDLDDGRKAELVIGFPVDRHDEYVYPELGRRQKITIMQSDGGDRSWLQRVWNAIGGERVTVRGEGSGLEVWADIELRVPSGRETEIYLGAGKLASAGVDGRLRLDSHGGAIVVNDHRGPLVCDTGSGGIEIAGADGPVLADTGSGSVVVRDQRGGDLTVDTGSGGVNVEGVDTGKLLIDTGSGGVVARGVRADDALIDTGSGSVVLSLDRMGDGRFVIDTGSGGVELLLPADASATISVDVGSGGIRNEIADATVLHEARDELKLRVGGGAADVVIDTGSGGVTVARH